MDVAFKPSLVRVLKSIENHYGKKLIVTSILRPLTQTSAHVARRIRCTCIAQPPTCRFRASASGSLPPICAPCRDAAALEPTATQNRFM